MHNLFFAGTNCDLLQEIHVPILAYSDLVFTGQEQQLLGSLQLVKITDILPVDPYSGALLNLGVAHEFNLAEHVVTGV